MSANTLSDRTYRDKYKASVLQHTLQNALVSEKIYDVDRTDSYRIQNPYSSQPTAAIGAVTGTYSVSSFTSTDDTLTVSLEVKISEHIHDFEMGVLTSFDMLADRIEEQAYAAAYQVDLYGLNYLLANGSGAYTTPTGGFTTAANVITILANLSSKFYGYAESYKGWYLVVENTDTTGIIQAQGTNGYTNADRALNNGLLTQYMNFDIYVVRSGTFQTATIGGTAFTNSGKRVAGIKGMATYAAPRGIRSEEKAVSGKTGVELVTFGYCGFKVWATKAALTVAITLA